jgi:RNA-directed DNA polymerase
MAKGTSGSVRRVLECWEARVNTCDPELLLYRAERRVLGIQTKLHRWATGDPDRRFDDLFNLVADPAFLLVAWERVRSNKGARTAGADGKLLPAFRTGRVLRCSSTGCGRGCGTVVSGRFRCGSE